MYCETIQLGNNLLFSMQMYCVITGLVTWLWCEPNPTSSQKTVLTNNWVLFFSLHFLGGLGGGGGVNFWLDALSKETKGRTDQINQHLPNALTTFSLEFITPVFAILLLITDFHKIYAFTTLTLEVQ